MNRQQRRAAKGSSGGAPSVDALIAQARAEAVAGPAGQAFATVQQALALQPRHTEGLLLAGALMLGADRAAAADFVARAARALEGGAGPGQHFRLGSLCIALGDYVGAEHALRAAVRQAPGDGEAHAALGAVLRQLGSLAAAADAYRRALDLLPDAAEILSSYGVVLRRLGRDAEAVAVQRAAVARDPLLAEAHYNLGNALRGQGEVGAAMAAFAEASRLKPGLVAARCNLGALLRDGGRLDEAQALFEQAMEIAPDFAEAWRGYGLTLRLRGRQHEAQAAYETFLGTAPAHLPTRFDLANVLFDQRLLDQTRAAYEAALTHDPASQAAFSGLIMVQQYRAEIDRPTRLATAKAFARRFEPGALAPPAPRPKLSRPLRVGYVSADLCGHPVGFFMLPVLAHHDRSAVEVFCYSSSRQHDDIARRLRVAADHWRDVADLPNAQLAALIAEDRIDLLVDLSGHTAGHRLGVFARRAAPVQVSWLGYWDTTGLSAMDYILSDATTIPDGEERFFTERVLRLPDTRFCFAPPWIAPDVAPLPALRAGQVRFGSFDNIAKIGPETISLWARLLIEVPGSTLMLKYRALADAQVRRRLSEAFVVAGVAAERIELRGGSSYGELLEQYGEIDIALDPLVFSGGATSCDALWMGVPVVTLPGAAPASRQTAGFLRAIGLKDCIAASEAEYIAIARHLAADFDALAALRSGLRARMAASPLCDAPRFVANLEASFRQMWARTPEQASEQTPEREPAAEPPGRNAPCPCGSGRRYKHCHGAL